MAACTRPEPTGEQGTHGLRYLKGPMEKELCYRRCRSAKLGVHSDADWAADLTDRRSVSGYCVSLNESGPREAE